MISHNRSLTSHQREWQSFYSGDANRILDFYNNLANRSTNSGRFWANLDRDEYKNVVHMPLAQDICSTSANLLFSESPDINLEETTAKERIEGFINDMRFDSFLLEAADMAAGLGGVFMKIDTDPAVSEYPFITTRNPINTKGRFKAGKLIEVEFKRLVKSEDDKKYYLIERRANQNDTMYITYEMRKYSGVEYDSVSMDEAVQDFDLDVEDTAISGVSGLGVVYVPNRLPNRLFLSSSQGVSDYQGSIGLLDSLDEVWTSWMRDIELGMSRILVDRDMLKSNQLDSTGKQYFDPHQRAFLKMDFDEWRMTGQNVDPITNLQFDIRYEEHSKSAQDLTEQIISRCGYAPQSFGMGIEGRADSGTALKIKERKSMVTRQNKARYWGASLEDLLFQVQEMDNATSLAPYKYSPKEVDVALSDSIQEDGLELSKTIRNLDQAKAISTKIKVAKAQPDWSEDQINEEVERIRTEQGAIVDGGIGG